MSSAPTDRSRILLALGVAAAALAASPAPPAARAGDGGEGPIFFREPDPATAHDIHDAISLFGDASPTNRERARNVLFDIGWWSVDPLRKTLRERKGQFLTDSLLVLGRLGDRRALPEMRDALKDDVAVWPPAAAALMLGRLRDDDEATFSVLRAAVTGGEKDLRRIAACLALAKLHRKRGPDCFPVLEQAFDARASNPAIHQAALLALGFFRSRVAEALPDGSGSQPTARLRAALGDKEWGMRLSAILAMGLAYNNAFHPLFVEAFQNDGDHQVRLAALLCLGRDRDPGTTALLAGVLEREKANGVEKRMAAYLLGRRPEALKGDARAFEAMRSVITGPRSSEVAAMALLGLAGVDSPKVLPLLSDRLASTAATQRAAAAVGMTRLVRSEDLEKARDLLKRRLLAGESDEAVRADVKLAIDEIGRILQDRDDAAKGTTPKARPPVAWQETDPEELFLLSGRDERQRLFDLVNLRAIQVLGIDGLIDYRPAYDPDQPAEGLGTTGTGGKSIRNNPGRTGSLIDQYDVRVELARRPYFVPEQDDPDAPTVPLPRETK